MTIRSLAAIGVAAVMISVSACGGHSTGPAAAPSGPTQLIGLFRLTPGAVKGDSVTGSWFRMVQPGGTAEAGPYMPNSDSPVPGGTATLLAPGTEGGLRTGGFQSEPNPAFADGHSLSGSIMKPTKFFAVQFGTSTNAVDLQTQRTVGVPTVTDDGGKLTADLSAWGASWNNQEFNQGAPKPQAKQGAEIAGESQVRQAWDWVAHKWLRLPQQPETEGPPATGHYDSSTHTYTLQWTSLIVGGPFNGFTGVWHLEGVFEPGQAAPVAAPPTTTR